MNTRKVLRLSGLALAGVVVIIVSVAMYLDIRPIAMGMRNSIYQTRGRALEGFDVVSYFQGKPIHGDERFSCTWGNATWLFSSPENREAFLAGPEKFVPEFGGYCTKAISTGFTAPGDPSVYAIRKGRLFIFSSETVKGEFMQHPEDIIAACNENWN